MSAGTLPVVVQLLVRDVHSTYQARDVNSQVMVSRTAGAEPALWAALAMLLDRPEPELQAHYELVRTPLQDITTARGVAWDAYSAACRVAMDRVFEEEEEPPCMEENPFSDRLCLEKAKRSMMDADAMLKRLDRPDAHSRRALRNVSNALQHIERALERQ